VETLFKGATRAPTYFGIPLKPFFFSAFTISILALLISIWFFLLLIPIYILMRIILKNDDKYFTELEARMSFFKKTKNSYTKNIYDGVRSYSAIKCEKNPHAVLDIQKQAIRERNIADHVPYVRHVSENIIKTNNNEFIACIELEGIHFYTVDEENVSQWKDSLNNTIKTIANTVYNISFWTHTIREKSEINKQDNFNNKFCQQLNQKYLNNNFKESYTNRLFLTLVLKNTDSEAESIQAMQDILSQITNSLDSYNPNILTTYTHKNNIFSKPLELFSYLINKEWVKIPVLNIPFNTYLALNTLLCSNEHIQIKTLNKTTIASILDIKEYEGFTTPEQLNEFLTVPFEVTISQSFKCMSKISATELLRIQQKHLNSSNDYALSQIDELDQALDDVQSARMVYGEHHCNIFVFADSQIQVDKNMAHAKEILSNMGITPKIVSPATECAFFASLPANFNYRLRPSPISSKNFACFANFHNHFSGKENNNPWGNCITVFETDNLTPLNFNFHEEANYDQTNEKALGNTLIIGQSGAGKTVLANFLLSNLNKFDTTTIFFDKDKGAKIAILAMGGKYFDLHLGEKTGWNPFQLEPTSENIIFLNELIKSMLCHSNRTLTIKQIKELENAINTVMTLDKDSRNLKNLALSMPAISPDDIGSRMAEWINNGQYAWLFDNQNDELDLNLNPIIAFDCTEFLEYPTIRTPLMMYLLHKMEQIIDGRKFTFFMDEFWQLLQDEVFTSFAKDKLKTIRKQNGLGIFMTQEPADALNSTIGKTIIQQTATQILLPNPKADNDDYIQGLKLTNTEFELLKDFDTNSRKFIVKKGHSSTIAKLNLYGYKELKVLSGNTYSTLLVEQLIKENKSINEWLEALYNNN
jgi:type IV secretion system protein VirB4